MNTRTALFRAAYDARLHWLRTLDACDPLRGRRPSDEECERRTKEATIRLRDAEAAYNAHKEANR